MRYSLTQWYSVSDFFVNTTYEDNYPTVNLEAKSCGAVVLSYRTGGSPESVSPGNVVERGDIGGLVRRIEEISLEGEEKNTDVSDNNIFLSEYLTMYSS